MIIYDNIIICYIYCLNNYKFNRIDICGIIIFCIIMIDFRNVLKVIMNEPSTLTYIEQIPSDLLTLITSYLSADDIKTLCRTSKTFNSRVCSNKQILLMLFARNLTKNPQRLNQLRSKSVKELQQLYQEAFHLSIFHIVKLGYEILLADEMLREQRKIGPYLLYGEYGDIYRASVESGHLDILLSYLTRLTGSPNYYAYYYSGFYNNKDFISDLIARTYLNNMYNLGDFDVQRLMNGILEGIADSGNVILIQWLVDKYPNITWDWQQLMENLAIKDKLETMKWVYEFKSNYRFNWAEMKRKARSYKSIKVYNWIEQNHLA